MIGNPIGYPIGGIVVTAGAVVTEAVGSAAGVATATAVGVALASATGAAAGSSTATAVGVRLALVTQRNATGFQITGNRRSFSATVTSANTVGSQITGPRSRSLELV